jgi:hypothetical protein
VIFHLFSSQFGVQENPRARDLILAVTNDKTEITESVAKMAVYLADYQLKVRKLLNPSEAQNVQARAENTLRDYFQRHAGKTFTVGRVADRTKLKKTIGVGLVRRAMDSLKQSGEIKQLTDKVGHYQWNESQEE